MKKYVFLFVVFIFLFSFVSVFAETEIVVTGTGEVRVEADTAIISLGVTSRDKQVDIAQQNVNKAVVNIREALIDLGIADENITTDFISIYAGYDYSDYSETIAYYNASTSLMIKVTDISKAGSVIDTAIRAGANQLNNISFSASDTEDAKKEAMKLAVENAKNKAEILADTTGMEIIGIETISEGGVSSYGNLTRNNSGKMMNSMETADSFDTVVQAAKIIVSSSVSIVFIAE